MWTWVCLGLAVPALGGVVTLMIATGTYHALSFTVASTCSKGRGYGPALSALTLAPWVAASGFAGQLVRRLLAGYRNLPLPATGDRRT